MVKVLSCIFLSIISTNLLAEATFDDLADFEDEFLNELPIVLSASRLAQPLNEAPIAMTIIDREMIDASGARTIPDLLRLVPGFQVGYFDGNSPVATYHGHGDEMSRRVQVLIDGRSVYVPSLAAIQWSALVITVDEIERIEVIRGSNAATYGNNSFLAVISITTRDAIEDQGHKIKLVAGSEDTIDTLYRFGGQIGSDIDYRITAGTQNNDGTDLLNDYTKANYLSYRIDFQADINNRISYQGGFKDLKLGDHEGAPDYQIENTTAFQWLKWEHNASNNDTLSLQYYYNYTNEDLTHENKIISLGAPIDPFPSAPVLILSERHDLELNYIQNFEKLRLVSGLSTRLDLVNGKNIFKNDDTLRHKLYRGFSHGEYQLYDNLLINAGFMLENNDISGTDFSPRLAIIHHINNKNTIRISASQATRTPTLFDQHAYLRINQQLTQDGGDPLSSALQSLLGGTDIINLVSLTSPTDVDSEEINSIELGFLSRLIENKLTLDIKIFKDHTHQLIGRTDKEQSTPEDNYVLDGKSHQILNTSQSQSKGIEISIDYKHSKDFRVYGYYAYIDIEAELLNTDPLGNDATPGRLEVSAPTNSYTLMLIKNWPKNFTSSLMFYRVGTFDWMDRTRNRGGEFWKDRNVHKYTKVDIKFDKLYKIGREKLKISLILQNLTNSFYDYNRTTYTDSSLTTVQPVTSGISNYGSLQDRRSYFELSYMFN